MNYRFLMDVYASFAAIGLPPAKLWRDCFQFQERELMKSNDVHIYIYICSLPACAGCGQEVVHQVRNIPRCHDKEDDQGASTAS